LTQRLVEQTLGRLAVVETESDLSIDEDGFDDVATLRTARARGQIVGADSEPLAENTQQLERRDPVTELHPGDVAGRTGPGGELALVHACGAPGIAQPASNRNRIVNMWCLLAIHGLYSCMSGPGLSPYLRHKDGPENEGSSVHAACYCKCS